MVLHKPTSKKVFSGTLRPARRGDLADIVRLEGESFDADRWPADALEDALEGSIQYPNLSSLVMAFDKSAKPQGKAKAKAAGYGLGWMDTATSGTIVSMAVGKDFRGQGLGRKLLDKVVADLAAMGAKKIILQVETTNTAAINLYATSGFVKERDLKNYYGAHRHAHLMTLKLRP